MSCDPRYARWRRIELREGERISGKVVRLPRSGAFNGGSVFLALDCDEVVALPATAQKGHTVLERLLGDVSVSDSVEIAYHGMRATADGERRYRDYELRVLGRQAVARLDDYRAMALRRGLALVGSGVNATATIPSELRARDQWVLWKYVERDGKRTKVPHQAATPWREASATDPSTWTDHERAVSKLGEPGIAGIGFVFTADDPFVGIDLDDCLDDDHGEIAPWAAEIVEKLDSYAERSPSGTGAHIFVKATLNGSRRRSGSFEVYDRARFFAMTGERLGTPETVEERQAELDTVVARMLPEREQLPPTPVRGIGLATADEQELLDRAFAAKAASSFGRSTRAT